MEHDQKTPVEPIKSSSSKFGVMYENQFVVLDDAKHVIGVDPGDTTNLILKNVENGSKVKFGGNDFSKFYISTLVYDEDTGSLYSGDSNGQLIQYKVDTANLTFEKVKDYGDLGIGWITSSHRFLHFVFFGGNDGKIRVLDLSTGNLLSGHIDTSIKDIRSLQVCLKNLKQIYLTVSGYESDYSNDKTDLFDITDFLLKDLIIFENTLPENSKNKNKTISKLQIGTKSQVDTIKKLTKKYKKYKTMYSDIKQKYDDLKKKHDTLRNKNKIIKKAYKTLKMESDRKYDQFTRKMNLLYQHRSNRTTIGNKMPLIGSGLFDETDPLVIIRDLKEDIEEQKYEYRQLQNSIYIAINQRRAAEEESRELEVELGNVRNQIVTIQQVLGQR